MLHRSTIAAPPPLLACSTAPCSTTTALH
ncbi:hypothetical protein Tco_0719788, partial [Tanacetum coccineum]